MAFDLSFTTNRDLQPSVIEAAFAPAESLTDLPPGERVLALVVHMVEIARPGEGAGRILDVLARLANAPWIEGSLDVLCQRHDEGTVLDVLVFDGLNYQRTLRTLLVPVPLSEFVEWFAMHQRELSPLALVRDVPGEELNLAAEDRPPPSDVAKPVFQPDISHKPTLRLQKVDVPAEAIPSQVSQNKPTPPPSANLAKTARLPGVADAKHAPADLASTVRLPDGGSPAPGPPDLSRTVRFDAPELVKKTGKDVDEGWE
ncbi:MAG: hypothetical protein R3B13_07545 [Polyangiaceae bacterium]